MNFSLLFAFLQSILSVVSNGTLSQSKKDTAIGYLGLLGALVDAGHDINEALLALTARLQQGDPITEDEWALMSQRSDKAHAIIQGSSEE